MSKRMTYDEFLKKYKEVHNDINYEFDESTFVDSHTPMIIWRILETPNILKYDCWQCSYEKGEIKNLLTTEKFIEKTKKHGDKYISSESIYNGKGPIKNYMPQTWRIYADPLMTI